MNQKYLLAILVSLLINLTYSQNHYNGRIIYNAYTDFNNLTTSLKDTSNFNKKKKIIL